MDNQRLPLVSVVIPTYNRIHTLPASVDSVLKQSYKNLELIIMDDGSTDGTEEYVKGITDARVRYRKADKNMGPSAARNRGAELAQGEYLAFQDSDDEWMPDKLEKQMKIMLGNKNVSLVYSEFGFYMEGKPVIVIPSPTISYEMKQGDLFSYLLLYPLISTQTILVKTKEFIEAGGFDETLKSYEDFEFSLRFAQNHQIGFVGEQLVRVNSTPGSVNKRLGERIRTQFVMVRKNIGALRERGLLEQKLQIVLNEAESLLCHDIFIEELQTLDWELLSAEEKESAAVLLEQIKANKEAVLCKEEMRETIPKLKQMILQIYMDLYEKKISWTEETRKLLRELAGGTVLFEKAFSDSQKVRECCTLIQKKLAQEALSETDGLYLLADIVELFEMLEKL